MNRINYISILVIILMMGGQSVVYSQTDDHILAKLDVSKKGTPISPKVFGMFLEHLGNVDVGDIIDDGLWAEVLDDRKFFYLVDTAIEQSPKNFRDDPNQWFPIGDPKTVIMDSVDSYVGIHTPKIITSNSKFNGIYQPGLILRSNIVYNGRIVLKADPGVEVTVILESGDDRSKKVIKGLTAEYNTYYFDLSLPSFQDEAKFIIEGKGNGSFQVGAVSLMPEDNIEGYRKDVIKLLKDLNSGIYRWGGNLSSGYDFRDGIGDPDKRPPRYDYAWNALENNDVGPDELATFAELIGVELSLTVNAGFGDAYSAAQFVEYMNGSEETPMGAVRAENGHPKPYNIKYWCVGNESYGWWQLGHTDLKYHIIKHNMFAEKMKEVDPSIKLIASGASLEEMTVTGNALKTTGKVLAEYDSESDWTGRLLRGALENIDYVSEHFYCSVDERFDIDSGKYIKVEEPLVEWTRRPANRIKAKSIHYDHYRKNIPGAKDIPVYLDEWAYYTNWVHPKPTLGVTIGYSRALNEIFRNSDLIKMAGLTFGTSCISFNDTTAIYNTTGLLYSLYANSFSGSPVKVTGNSPQPAPFWPVGGGQPEVNAGSNTYPLDITALITDENEILLSVINPTEKDVELDLELIDASVKKPITIKTIIGEADARNIVGANEEVKIKEGELSNVKRLIIHPVSINMIQFFVVDK
jgi:alpha-N-arabinofuranosidase